MFSCTLSVCLSFSLSLHLADSIETPYGLSSKDNYRISSKFSSGNVDLLLDLRSPLAYKRRLTLYINSHQHPITITHLPKTINAFFVDVPSNQTLPSYTIDVMDPTIPFRATPNTIPYYSTLEGLQWTSLSSLPYFSFPDESCVWRSGNTFTADRSGSAIIGKPIEEVLLIFFWFLQPHLPNCSIRRESIDCMIDTFLFLSFSSFYFHSQHLAPQTQAATEKPIVYIRGTWSHSHNVQFLKFERVEFVILLLFPIHALYSQERITPYPVSNHFSSLFIFWSSLHLDGAIYNSSKREITTPSDLPSVLHTEYTVAMEVDMRDRETSNNRTLSFYIDGELQNEYLFYLPRTVQFSVCSIIPITPYLSIFSHHFLVANLRESLCFFCFDR